MKIVVQNMAIEYMDEGSGPIMLFLHGWQDNFHTFDTLARYFVADRRVIRVDLPMFGGSEMPKTSWDLDDYIKFVADFIKKLDIQVNILAGHSFGGRIAIKGSATGLIKADKIILIASAGIARKHTFRNSIIKVLAKIGGLIAYIPPLVFWRQKMRRKLYGLLGSDYLEAGATKETFLKIIGEDLSSFAGKIIRPTLLIWGSDDMETPLADGKRLSGLIPNSKLKVIDGAGHFVHKEKAEEVAALIKKFYD
jgi:pimeloyl-ACP methyl ester carboxylesterase